MERNKRYWLILCVLSACFIVFFCFWRHVSPENCSSNPSGDNTSPAKNTLNALPASDAHDISPSGDHAPLSENVETKNAWGALCDDQSSLPDLGSDVAPRHDDEKKNPNPAPNLSQNTSPDREVSVSVVSQPEEVPDKSPSISYNMDDLIRRYGQEAKESWSSPNSTTLPKEVSVSVISKTAEAFSAPNPTISYNMDLIQRYGKQAKDWPRHHKKRLSEPWVSNHNYIIPVDDVISFLRKEIPKEWQQLNRASKIFAPYFLFALIFYFSLPSTPPATYHL
ncbi:MAG: hypothetical protein ACPGC9_01835 [Cytophagales bacterium]